MTHCARPSSLSPIRAATRSSPGLPEALAAVPGAFAVAREAIGRLGKPCSAKPRGWPEMMGFAALGPSYDEAWLFRGEERGEGAVAADQGLVIAVLLEPAAIDDDDAVEAARRVGPRQCRQDAAAGEFLAQRVE